MEIEKVLGNIKYPISKKENPKKPASPSVQGDIAPNFNSSLSSYKSEALI